LVVDGEPLSGVGERITEANAAAVTTTEHNGDRRYPRVSLAMRAAAIC